MNVLVVVPEWTVTVPQKYSGNSIDLDIHRDSPYFDCALRTLITYSLMADCYFVGRDYVLESLSDKFALLVFADDYCGGHMGTEILNACKRYQIEPQLLVRSVPHTVSTPS